MSGSIPKPALRGFLSRRLKFHTTIGFTLSISAALLWRFGFADKRKQTYLDFYKTYDSKAEFERMQNAGAFQSVNPDGSVNPVE